MPGSTSTVVAPLRSRANTSFTNSTPGGTSSTSRMPGAHAEVDQAAGERGGVGVELAERARRVAVAAGDVAAAGHATAIASGIRAAIAQGDRRRWCESAASSHCGGAHCGQARRSLNAWPASLSPRSVTGG